jgi:hypothetical protein
MVSGNEEFDEMLARERELCDTGMDSLQAWGLASLEARIRHWPSKQAL